MNEAKCAASACSLGGKIYVIGGRSGNGR